MTLLPSPLAQSGLGEKCAVYLDHVTHHISTLHPRLELFRTWSARALPFPVDDQAATLCTVVLGCVLVAVAMSWRNPLSWRGSSNTSAPRVSDRDFSYITPDDIVDPPSRYDAQDDNEPDVIRLKHRGTIYPLRFRAYAIDDGALNVGTLREEAAAKTGTNDPDRIRLLYKGKLLKDDKQTCKAEGLKQHSLVLCVVTEVGAKTPSDLSDFDTSDSLHVDGRPASSSSRTEEPRETRRNRPVGSPSLGPPRPSPGPSGTPSPAPSLRGFRTALEQVNALTSYFQQVLVPLCNDYMADPPSDQKKRDYENKKLSETIMAQVLLKADEIELDGDAARNARRALIKETQAMLTRLDQHANH